MLQFTVPFYCQQLFEINLMTGPDSPFGWLMFIFCMHRVTTFQMHMINFSKQQFQACEDCLCCFIVGSMTYAELDDITDRLAKFLRLKGVVPDSCVGIYMDKNLEYVISYVAILKAGEHLIHIHSIPVSSINVIHYNGVVETEKGKHHPSFSLADSDSDLSLVSG